MTRECDGCGAFADVVAVYEGDDPSTGYVGSVEPAYLCWGCRHPFAEQIRAAERRANRSAMLLLGVVPDERGELTSAEPCVAQKGIYCASESALVVAPSLMLMLWGRGYYFSSPTSSVLKQFFVAVQFSVLQACPTETACSGDIARDDQVFGESTCGHSGGIHAA